MFQDCFQIRFGLWLRITQRSAFMIWKIRYILWCQTSVCQTVLCCSVYFTLNKDIGLIKAVKGLMILIRVFCFGRWIDFCRHISHKFLYVLVWNIALAQHRWEGLLQSTAVQCFMLLGEVLCKAVRWSYSTIVVLWRAQFHVWSTWLTTRLNILKCRFV